MTLVKNAAPRLAIVGAGPMGMEAALEGAARGYDVAVYEAGRVGENLRRFEWVRLFTPFEMNSTERGRARLTAAGVALPQNGAILTAGEIVSSYLEPLSRLPELEGRVHERVRVSSVGRDGVRQSEGAVSARARSHYPFLLRVEPAGGPARFDRADVVLDASGVYASPRATGPGGLPALGEDRLDGSIERHLVPIAGAARERYAGKRVLLIGNGYSAATALCEFDRLARAGSPARVVWARPAREGAAFSTAPGDALPERAALGAEANRIAASASWLEDRPGVVVETYETQDGGCRVTLRAPDGARETVAVDRVLALVGYQPDLDLSRELQIHLCYASEGPMALAGALLAASHADPAAGGDCLKQVSHGPDTLKNPEPDFYIVGVKSYGRNPHFVLSLGHRQILDVMGLIEAGLAAAEPAQA